MDAPILVTARQFSNHDRRTQFAKLLIGLGEAKEDYLAICNHENDSLMSSRE